MLKNWKKVVGRRNMVAWETEDGKKFVYVSKQFLRKGKDWEVNMNDERVRLIKTKAKALKIAKAYMRQH